MNVLSTIMSTKKQHNDLFYVSPHGKGKLNISPEAMKIAARSIRRSESDTVITAREAIKTALRHDNRHYPCVIKIHYSSKNKPIALNSKITYVLGTNESDISDAAFGWFAQSGFSGVGAFIITPSRNEKVDFVGYENVHRTTFAIGVEERVIAKLKIFGGADNQVLVPDLKTCENERNDYLVKLIRGLNQKDILIIDRPHGEPADKKGFMSALRSREGKAVITFTNTEQMRRWVSPDDLSPDDDIIIMSLNEDFEQGINVFLRMGVLSYSKLIFNDEMFSGLKTREGYLISKGNLYRIKVPSLRTQLQMKTSEKDRAITYISERLRFNKPETHVECLELVANACGYRSWHAAQGRKPR